MFGPYVGLGCCILGPYVGPASFLVWHMVRPGAVTSCSILIAGPGVGPGVGPDIWSDPSARWVVAEWVFGLLS